MARRKKRKRRECKEKEEKENGEETDRREWSREGEVDIIGMTKSFKI
jgi:hypothetical protein